MTGDDKRRYPVGDAEAKARGMHVVENSPGFVVAGFFPGEGGKVSLAMTSSLDPLAPEGVIAAFTTMSRLMQAAAVADEEFLRGLMSVANLILYRHGDDASKLVQ